MLWAREPRGQGPKKAAVQGLGPAQLPFWVPGLVTLAWSLPVGSLAQCTHKSVVHAQESCACTRILCMHKNLDKQTPVLAQYVPPAVFFFRKKDVP